MAGRSLYPDEAALWAQVMRSVRPIRPAATVPAVVPAIASGIGGRPPKPKIIATNARLPPPLPPTRKTVPGVTLDGGWDRRIARGIVSPDRSIDLHGHTLASAHAVLDDGLYRAIRDGDRVVLLVTGKPPRPESERPHGRGVIRASVADWLAASRHAGYIAAVRGAHPRHGGSGALYIVLRRARGG